MVTPAASEVETRLPASPLQLWASPAQAKQTLLQKRRRVDAPRAHILGLPSRRARVKAEPTSCRRGGCGWAAGRPVAGARQAVARRRRSACYKFGVPVRFLSRVRKGSIRVRQNERAKSRLTCSASSRLVAAVAGRMPAGRSRCRAHPARLASPPPRRRAARAPSQRLPSLGWRRERPREGSPRAGARDAGTTKVLATAPRPSHHMRRLL